MIQELTEEDVTIDFVGNSENLIEAIAAMHYRVVVGELHLLVQSVSENESGSNSESNLAGTITAGTVANPTKELEEAAREKGVGRLIRGPPTLEELRAVLEAAGFECRKKLEPSKIVEPNNALDKAFFMSSPELQLLAPSPSHAASGPRHPTVLIPRNKLTPLGAPSPSARRDSLQSPIGRRTSTGVGFLRRRSSAMTRNSAFQFDDLADDTPEQTTKFPFPVHSPKNARNSIGDILNPKSPMNPKSPKHGDLRSPHESPILSAVPFPVSGDPVVIMELPSRLAPRQGPAARLRRGEIKVDTPTTRDQLGPGDPHDPPTRSPLAADIPPPIPSPMEPLPSG